MLESVDCIVPLARFVRRFLTLTAIVEIAAALHALLLGGFYFTVGPLPISARGPYKPFVIGVVCGCISAWLYERETGRTSWRALKAWSGAIAAILAVATLAAGIHFGAFAAGGSDSYGYVSQALLWAKGNLFVKEPLATIHPLLAPAATPFGYRLTGSDTSVSIYSPGLPMMMAAAFLTGGEYALYLVVPLLGALTVWLTYVLGRYVGDWRTGLLAAIAMACSPIFLIQLFMPMSDVPAAAWWLAAIVIALSNIWGAAFLAGLASSLAVLTRPNLVPLAVAIALLVVVRQPESTAERKSQRQGTVTSASQRAVSGLLFGLGVLPGCAAVAILQQTLYGSATLSGYGPLQTLFKWEWAAINLQHYPKWLLEIHSAALLLAFIGLFPRQLSVDPQDNERPQSNAVTMLLAAYCVLVFACYLFYIPFEGWQNVRFLLPSVPVLLVLSARGALAIVDRFPSTMRSACFVAMCSLVAASYVDRAHRLGVFFVREDQRRFLTIGRYLGRALPQNAVVFAGMHSGSLRLYGNRPTVRWTQLQSQDLDAAVSLVTANGYSPYLLAESEEEQEFRQRFASTSALGRLDWAPIYQYAGHIGARVYSFAERARGSLPQAIPPE